MAAPSLGRLVGCAAAALGAGVIVGLAAPASADQADGTPGPAAASRSAAAPRRGAGTAPAAALSNRTPRPAAAVRSRVPFTTTLKTNAVESPAAGPAPKAAAAARPLFNWGDPRGRLITIYKGTHFAIPNSLGFFIKKVTGTGTFTTNTVYDLKDVDQYDWNKFTGIAFTPLQPDKNSAMVGWRYNLRTQEFEIAPFYNVDKKRILPNEDTEVISVPAGETFSYTVDYTGITISYGDETKFKAYPEGLTPNVWTAARVSGWFGGNEVAPRTVSYYLKINR